MENDYGAMKKLTDYFGDRHQIIQDCMTEVNNFPKVSPNDFKNLVLLKSCIEINYARLKSRNLENEISNTQTMKNIEAKFPLLQQTEWTKYLEEQLIEIRNNSFPELLKWV